MWALIDLLRELIVILAALVCYDLLLDGTVLADDTLPGAVACVVFVYLVFSLYARRHHRSRLDPGLHPRRLPRTVVLFAAGTAIGLGLCSTMLAVEHYFATPYVPEPVPPVSLVRLAASDLVPSVNEEIVFRASILRILFGYFGLVPALVMSSLAFGVMHMLNPNATALTTMLIAAEAGLLFGCVYLLTGSIWMPAGIHFGWNLAQSIVYRFYVLAMLEDTPLGQHLAQFVDPSRVRYGPEHGWPALVIGTTAGLIALYVLLRVRKNRPIHLEPPIEPASASRAVPA